MNMNCITDDDETKHLLDLDRMNNNAKKGNSAALVKPINFSKQCKKLKV
uniref:Uncharacterized protein n=1 Tax=Meloidogyne enterolobii TaxID=390850 RepID=A0A6V7VSV6_MELEN|nr:unnamed protein product [Meloidogyne enterolobii]